MYEQIKQLADEAVALQNKDRMDAALREISAMCDPEVLLQMADSVMLASTSTSFSLAEAKELMPAHKEYFDSVMTAAKPGDSVQITGISDGAGNETSTSFPFDRQPAKSLPVAPLVTEIFDAAVTDASLDVVVTQPGADPAPAAAEEGGAQ